ncbi:hypothetical protein MA16_Dca005515 [Dendrobium catenatum]|uniref:Uncharacterized protein n=1 Tax=Dendrobium catenatum TaxID=906689 RepID=A0A2I0X3M7_9ASPA|nr:hypothetical protein MA16_Dca005515 [Dendrobium catenatum]
MEQRRLLPAKAWKKYRKGLTAPVLDSSEVFNGGSKVLDGFNQNSKIFKEKPLIINEGGLLGRKELPIQVPGKGKDVVKEDGPRFLEVSPIQNGGVKYVGERNFDASSSGGLRISSNFGFHSKSLSSSPVERDVNRTDMEILNSRGASNVIEVFPHNRNNIIPEEDVDAGGGFEESELIRSPEGESLCVEDRSVKRHSGIMLKMDKGQYMNNSNLAGSHSFQKKTKLIKELKSLGSVELEIINANVLIDDNYFKVLMDLMEEGEITQSKHDGVAVEVGDKVTVSKNGVTAVEEI